MSYRQFRRADDQDRQRIPAQCHLDGYGFESFAVVNHLQLGAVWDVSLWDVGTFSSSDRIISRHRPGGRGRTVQYEFFNNVADQPMEIFKIEQEYNPYRYH